MPWLQYKLHLCKCKGAHTQRYESNVCTLRINIHSIHTHIDVYSMGRVHQGCTCTHTFPKISRLMVMVFSVCTIHFRSFTSWCMYRNYPSSTDSLSGKSASMHPRLSHNTHTHMEKRSQCQCQWQWKIKLNCQMAINALTLIFFCSLSSSALSHSLIQINLRLAHKSHENEYIKYCYDKKINGWTICDGYCCWCPCVLRTIT